MEYVIQSMKPEDWPRVAEIYRGGIDTGLATFQSEVPSWEEWDRGHIASCRLVVRLGRDVAGWAALSAVSNRAVYAGVAEVSIYIDAKDRGKGLGKVLLEALVRCSETAGFWMLQGGIIRNNTASIRLHESCGFRLVGVRERIARMPDGSWHDTVLMERRSRIAGS